MPICEKQSLLYQTQDDDDDEVDDDDVDFANLITLMVMTIGHAIAAAKSTPSN